MNEIFFTKKFKVMAAPGINNDWVIKIPTVDHRLSRLGTVALKMSENYDLKSKKGVIYVDMTLKKYVLVPKEILEEHFLKMADYSGVKNCLWVYDIKTPVQLEKIQLKPILTDEKPEPVRSSVAQDIRRKFGI